MKKELKTFHAWLLFAAAAVLLSIRFYYGGTYPGDGDTMGYLYKASRVCEAFASGELIPMYDPFWYNGAELFQYCAPLPIYLLSLCMILAGGDAFYGYLVFAGVVFFVGACGWFWCGERQERQWLGLFLGLLWFFMPTNLYVFFVEGNLGKTVCIAILPLLIGHIYGFLLQERWSGLPWAIFCFFLMFLCDVEFTIMTGIAVGIWMLFYVLLYRHLGRPIQIVAGMALAFAMTGIWSYGFVMHNETASMSTAQIQEFFQPGLLSLNPLHRMTEGGMQTVYFGAAAFALALFGMVFGYRKSIMGFVTSILLFLGSLTSMCPVVMRLPGSEYLMMLCYAPLAVSLILFSFLLWDRMRRPFVVFFCLLLFADALPSAVFVLGDGGGKIVEQRLEEFEEETLLLEAKKITVQRLALLDHDALSSVADFLAAGYHNPVKTSMGADPDEAATAENIRQLMEAMENDSYLYLFDRCLELGNDTVLVCVSQLGDGANGIEDMDAAAAQVGYHLIDSRGDYRLYHMKTPDSFGVISDYRVIGIGNAIRDAARSFPAMEETTSTDLNDYTFEELAKYDLVYLAGFTYTDKEQAEQMVQRLGENGTRVVIAADGIPIDMHTGVQSFLGVGCYNIRFRNGYPLLYTADGVLDCDLFPDGYADWKTVYVNGLDRCLGYFDDIGERLEFFGTVKNDNIYVIGLNLTYHYGLTGDRAVGKLLGRAMSVDAGRLPERKIVPVEIRYQGNRIQIESEYDRVNVCLAYHDNMQSEQVFKQKNNLIYVNHGNTTISLTWTDIWERCIMSLAGIVLTALFLGLSRLWSRRNAVSHIGISLTEQPEIGRECDAKLVLDVDDRCQVENMEWYAASGEKLPPSARMEAGEYCLKVQLSAGKRETFSKDIEVLVDGKPADKTEINRKNTVIDVYKMYYLQEPVSFLVQPADCVVDKGEEVRVAWKLSQPASVGYLQKKEENDWRICGVLDREAQTELAYSFSDAKEQGTYRLLYIMKNGKTVSSREFQVKWKENLGNGDAADE